MVLSIREPSLPYIPHGKFGLWTGYIFAINCTIGAGFLSIPWAFDSAGWLFSLIYQIIVSIQSYCISMQTLEIMSRAEILIRMTEEGKDIHKIPLRKIFSKPNINEKLIQPPHLRPIITNRLITCSDMMKLVFGESVGRLYLFSLFLYQLGTMVAYASIFASSFASNVPLGEEPTCDIYSTSSFYNSCRWKYWVFLLVFGIFTVYMTVRGIEEQKYVQLSMSVLRFVVMFLIIFTCIADIAFHKNNSNDNYNDISSPPLFVGKNIGHAIPIILFASTYQVQIPTISDSVKDKTTNLPIINTLAVITCSVFYIIIGVIVSIAINSVPSLTSLSYRNYTGGYSRDNRPFWSYFIEYLVVISPALDVFSSYPLQGLTISEAILNWRYKGDPELTPIKLKYLARFVIAFAPLLISFFEYDLGTILDWVGLMGFIIVQCCIPLLHISLRHLVAGESPYDINIPISVSWGMIVFNFVLFWVVIALNLTYSD